jgi:tetratricopeptide (TPR) repeat protein
MWLISLVWAGSMPVLVAQTNSETQTNNKDQALNREFQVAVAQYESGHLPEAAGQLEKLLHAAPESFEVHELLGMIYAAQSQDARASEHLETAVRLKPDSAAARTNLATVLVHLGKLQLAEAEFKKALTLEPGSYDTNHNIGEFYIRAGRIAEATPFLDKAQQLKPGSYDNGYDLSMAYLQIGRMADARRVAVDLIKQKETAELHNLLGQIEEKDGNFLVAANEFQTAAHMDPSEQNLFDWGSELLLHQTLDPAIQVFQHAVELYPNSPRLSIGLGMALYSRGNYDEAVKSLLRGADLNPSDPRCYYFLSKAYDSSPNQADAVIARFRRFALLQPSNALAQYYYAISLWKGKRVQDSTLDTNQVESSLKSAIRLDANLAEAHLQLANLYSDQSKFANAIPEYELAVKLNPQLADAHYRLAQAYIRTGQKQRAQPELEVYQRLRAEHLAELDKQRAEIRQFVYSSKDASGSKQP